MLRLLVDHLIVGHVGDIESLLLLLSDDGSFDDLLNLFRLGDWLLFNHDLVKLMAFLG